MTTTRTKHAGGTTVEVFDLTPFGFMGFNTNPLRQDFGDPWHLYGYGLEAAPVASSVAFTGTETVGQLLTGTYTYSDADGDLEGTTTFQWYRSNDGSGTGKAAIAGATGATYTLVGADEGKYITFGVTPVALTGTTMGTEVQSTYSGVVGPRTSQTLQFVSQNLATSITTTNSFSGGIPASTEGATLFSQAITPKKATSDLIIDVVCPLAYVTDSDIIVAVFDGTVFKGMGAGGLHGPAAGQWDGMKFRVVIPSEDSSARTYTIKFGSTGASTVYASTGGAWNTTTTRTLSISEVL